MILELVYKTLPKNSNKIRFIVFFFLCSVSHLTLANSNELAEYELLFKQEKHTTLIKKIASLDASQLTPELYTLYVYSLATKDLDDAEEAVEVAIGMFKDNPDIYLLHASIMGDQAQDSIFSALTYAEKALNSLNKAVELSPNKPKYRRALMTFYLAAPSIAGGDTELALEQVNIIKELDHEAGIIALSHYYRATDDIEKSYQVVDDAIALSPASYALQNHLGFLYLRDENYSEAIPKLIKSVTLLPSYDLENLTKEDKESYQSKLNSLLNSHYQIGRSALLGEVMLNEGIEHMDIYIEKYKASTYNLSGLPTLNWAKLRKSALLLAANETLKAKLTFDQVIVEDDKQMKKVHKKLGKQIKRAVKNIQVLD